MEKELKDLSFEELVNIMKELTDLQKELSEKIEKGEK